MERDPQEHVREDLLDGQLALRGILDFQRPHVVAVPPAGARGVRSRDVLLVKAAAVGVDAAVEEQRVAAAACGVSRSPRPLTWLFLVVFLFRLLLSAPGRLSSSELQLAHDVAAALGRPDGKRLGQREVHPNPARKILPKVEAARRGQEAEPRNHGQFADALLMVQDKGHEVQRGGRIGARAIDRHVPRHDAHVVGVDDALGRRGADVQLDAENFLQGLQAADVLVGVLKQGLARELQGLAGPKRVLGGAHNLHLPQRDVRLQALEERESLPPRTHGGEQDAGGQLRQVVPASLLRCAVELQAACQEAALCGHGCKAREVLKGF